MGKKNKNRHNGNPQPRQSEIQSNQSNVLNQETKENELHKLQKEVITKYLETIITEEVIEKIENQPETDEMKQAIESNDIKQTWEKVKELWKLAEAILQTEHGIKQKKEDLDKKENDVRNQIEVIQRSERALLSKEKEILSKEEDLLIREKNATDGFTLERKKHLETFRNEIDSLTTQINALHQTLDSEKIKIEKRKVELEVSYEDKKEKLQQEYSNKSEQLNQKEEGYKNSYEVRIEKLEKERDDLLASIDDDKHINEKEYNDKLATKQKELDSKIQDYQNKIKELDDGNQSKWDNEFKAEWKRLQTEIANLKIDKEMFEEDQKFFQDKLTKGIAKEKERFESEIRDLETKLEEARKIRDEKEERLRLREEADRRFGNQTPDEVLIQNNALKKENESLREKLASKADETSLTRLEELERREQEWNQERRELNHKVSVLEAEKHSSSIDVAKFEDLREENESLFSRIKLKEQIIGDLQKDVDNYTKKAEEKKTFPACSDMDKDEHIQRKNNNEANIVSLLDLISKSKHRIASLEKKNPLYYADDTLRTFVSGLAMSRLTILQGISGTGKTSLPVSFAKAIGGHYSIIEVQSGWKDKQDLIGYYNTFEGKYYESDFLKALYEASCPAYANRPYFIILDEMNLSHPEHYFADFLSMLEQKEEDRKLKLVTHDLPNPPKLISGSKLKIPSNVWFIGTANHDETTLQFAPKTIDRANVMEMPKNNNPFTERSHEELYITNDSLETIFQKAFTTKSSEVDKPIKYLNEILKKDLEQYKIGWGNRLESQLQKFIPVYLVSGGNMASAMDHIIYTKIFRNLKDRFDIKVDRLKMFKDKFEESFKNEFNDVALRSQELLNEEISNRDSNSDS
jgi:hypothetical protein